MGMLSEANQALGLLINFIDHEKYVNSVVGRIPISIHPSLYRACKLTFPQDIRGLTRDSTIDNLHMVHTIIEKVDGYDTLINLGH